LAKKLGAPLEEFLAALEQEIEPARVAALPARAQGLLSQLGEALRKEVEKRDRAVEAAERPSPVREVRAVRFSDVTTVRRVRTLDEWDNIQRKLDERVRTLLRDFDVELEP
jgi:hypothetical protein